MLHIDTETARLLGICFFVVHIVSSVSQWCILYILVLDAGEFRAMRKMVVTRWELVLCGKMVPYRASLPSVSWKRDVLTQLAIL